MKTYTLTSGASGAKKLQIGERMLVMGILNITPDSFSDGGLYFAEGEGTAAAHSAAAVSRAEEMIREGVDIIDIGGESTRPGSNPVTAAEEIARVVPVIRAIRETLGAEIWLSVDTDKAEVAEAALAAGADMLNSLGGVSRDPRLLDVLKKYNCSFCIYHVKGDPKTMQSGEIIYADVIKEIRDFFAAQIEECERAGIARARIVLDPGIGFGKTVEQNVEIINRLEELTDIGCPLLIGVSRKSHLGAILKSELHLSEVPGPLLRVEAGLAETAIAIEMGARIARTHDVLSTKKFLAAYQYIRAQK